MPLPSASGTSFITRAMSPPASAIGMSPISPPRGEYQPSNRSAPGAEPRRIASSTSGSVRVSCSSWYSVAQTFFHGSSKATMPFVPSE